MTSPHPFLGPAPPDLELIFNSIPGAFLVLSPDLTVVAASDELLRVTGTRRLEVIGRAVFEAFPGDPSDDSGSRAWRASLEKVLRARQADFMPLVRYRVARPDGEGNGHQVKIWQPANYPILGPDGALRYILHRTEEVTEQQELAIRAEKQIADVLESMSDAFFSVDRDWRITRVNAQHEKATRRKREHQLGRNLLELYFGSPEARESRYWKSYHQVMRERVPVQFEEYYPPLDLWTAVRAFPTADGGMAVFFVDISAQKRITRQVEAEKQKFEAIFVDSPASMALLRGREFVFEKVNPKYRELMGGRDLEGKPLLEALPELVGQPFPDLMKQVFETGEPFVAHEMIARLIRRPGGEPEDTYFDFTYSRIDDGQHNPYGVYIHASDITDKVLARRRVEKLAEDLRAAVRARDEFLSIASHELRTPMTSLKMQLQMSRRGVKPERGMAPPPESLVRTLDLCLRQVDRLTALIEDLLDVSRIESGRMAYRFEPVDLGALVGEVLDRFSEQLRSAGCSARLSVRDDVSVTCDRFRIEQVVTNLLTNAMKYGEGSVVRIELEATSEGARIRVSDEGLGIASELQARVFDRFERAISHNNISGLGLGLYISRQIVEAHGGTIGLRSELGRGSTFTIELPREPAARAGQVA